MGRLVNVGLAALSAVTFCAVGSCAPPRLPTSDQMAAALSSVIMRPDRTCDQMRADFGVGPIPLINTPADIGVPYEEHSVPTATGEKLRVWFLPAEHERGVVVFSIGNSGSMQCYFFTGWLLWRGGWSVVMYDYEGFGDSEGTASLLSLKPDLDAVVSWVRADKGYAQVSLMGISLGSIPSIAVAVEQPEAVNAVVLDSPVALATLLEHYNYLLAGRADAVLAALPSWLDVEAQIAHLEQPVLVFEDEQDAVTPAATIDQLYNLIPGPKQIVRFPGLGHARGQFFDTATYTLYLDLFLGNAWGN